ncbi:AMP-binding protein [Solemya velesiana gill symbiont]|uniref:AMP-binding protein n=1 Tax=Solemya velesiana gill symbiont TaxID=1918948 RepID=UPI002482046F|nr:AMP-binding protein [Solemya velesiana gill symbiont]
MLLDQHQNTALIRGDQSVSYSELLAWVDGYARHFPDSHCDKVVVFSENRLEWVYAYYAGLKHGCTMVPVDFMSSAEDVAYILGDCRPDLIFCSKDRWSRLSAWLKSRLICWCSTNWWRR